MLRVNLGIDLASVTLLFILLAVYFVRKSYSTRAHKVFLMILCLNALSTITDITIYTLVEMVGLSDRLATFLHIFVLWTRFSLGALVLLYAGLFVREGKTIKAERALLLGIIAVYSILILSAPVNGWAFRVEAGRFVRGELFWILLLTEVVAIGYSILLFVFKREKMNFYQSLGALFCAILIVSGQSLQFWIVGLHTESFALSLALMVICILLENPSDYMYKNTYCFNDKAFLENVKGKQERRQEFAFTVFSLENFNYFKEYVGSIGRNSLTETTLNYLRKIYPQKSVYYLGEHRFCIFTNDKAPEIGDIVTEIERYFAHEFRLPGMDIAMIPFFVHFRSEDFEGTPEEIFECVTFPFTSKAEFAGKHSLNAAATLLAHKQREDKVRHAMSRALHDRSFEVFYQPIFEGDRKCFASAEALLRLRDPELGFIRPDEFIPIAEKDGMIVEIGEFVFESVCRFWNENNLASLGVEFIEVNLSMIQCMQDNLSSRLRTIMASHDIDPKHINLEITESAASLDEKAIINNMQSLSKSGVGFSLDDYGTGFSTANRLIDLPVEIVKVDKSILWRAMENEQALSILRNTIKLLKDLKKQCVVEGVEDSRMAKALRELGCDFYQGYLFSKPIPGNEFINFLKNNEFAGSDKAFCIA